ncbi:transient receptor potential channel pyrexia-like [Tigriopus californicus]|nr:transient receptor potential channel pyrexia-like [Tigriopus californicus]
MDLPMSQKKKATVGDFVQTRSCIGEPRSNALHCLLERQLTVFTDILNEPDPENRTEYPLPDDHWINQPLAEEDDKTLLMLALERDLHDFTKVLLQTGASAKLFNPILGRSPIHVAVMNGNLRSLELLFSIGSNMPNINAIMRSNGRTALHLCAEKKKVDCLKFLLAQAGIDPNIKDKKNAQTPLYLAVKVGSLEMSKALVEGGSDFEYVCFGRPIYPDLMNDKLPGFNPTLLQRKAPTIVQQLSQGSFEALISILDKAAKIHCLRGSQSTNKDEESDQLLADFQSLMLQTDSFSLNNRVTGGSTILQKACDLGLDDYVEELLSEGYDVDPDGTTESRSIPPLLLAANKGHMKCVLKLAECKATLNKFNTRTQESVLHCLLKTDNRNNAQFVETLLDLLSMDELIPEIQKIINKRDKLENTALHYATQMWPQTVVRKLLDLGANIGMKNHWNETPVTKIRPETLEAYLDDCIEAEGEVNHENFSVTYNYSFLAPPKEDLPYVNRDLVPRDPENQKLADDDEDEKVPLPETQTLWHMGQSKAHRHLLKHPVITSFLYLKWGRIRRYFNRNLRFYVLFVFVLTWFIFENFGGKTLRSGESQSIPALHVLYFVFAFILVGFILRDWAMDIKDVMRAEQMKSNNSGMEEPTSSGKLALIIIFSNWVESLFIIFLGLVLVGGVPYLWSSLLFLTIVLLVREFFQVSVSLKRYICSPENWIEVAMISLIGFILFLGDEHHYNLKRHFSAIVLVLSWAEFITLVGKHPKLSRYNVYVTMFYKVLATFFFFLCWYMFFIIAFGLGFYIMLHRDGPLDVVGDDDYVFFNRPWTALVKTSTMFVGELEFSDIPIDLESNLSPLSYLFFLSFVFLIVVVLMNLLNGLAVSDTGVIQEKAEIVSYISRVETISYTESVLLGDPFNFLSNWPALKWLLNMPSCSLCAQLYKSKTMQRIFNKITGATGILLFYTFLTTKKLTIKPNGRKSDCDCLRVELMDEDIIACTKDIVLQKDQQSPQDDRLEKLETKFGQGMANLSESVESRITRLEEKIDLLVSSMYRVK